MMPSPRRILIVDDTRAIHDDFRKILAPSSGSELRALEEELFGAPERAALPCAFQLSSAYQGAEGIECVRAARLADRPYALAFVDMRMPPGLDGLETIERMWAIDPELQIVICTAYSDASWAEIIERFGATDRLLILKKPFDLIEVLQLSLALTEKWRLAAQAKVRLDELSRSRAELAAGLALAQAIQDATGEGILVTGLNHEVKTANPRLFEIWRVPAIHEGGAPLGPAIDRTIDQAIDQVVDPSSLRSRIRHLCAHPAETATDDVRLKDGRVLECWTAPMRSAAGDHHGRVWCFRDISERRNLELDRAIATERLASMGRLAAGVGHEINNPLTYVLCNVEDLLASHRDGPRPSVPDVVEALTEARDGLSRIRVIVRDLQTLARVEAEHGQVDLGHTVDRAIQIATAEVRHRAHIVRNYQPAPPVTGSTVRLGQVFLNLIINAAQSIPDGQASANRIEVVIRATRTESIVEVIDSGCGIDPRNLERIFDPFFTTKDVGQGTGLGLSICREIVQGHGGTISAQSRLGRGTTMRVSLPASSPSSAVKQVAPASAGSARRARLLIVDDEPLVARSLERLLGARHTVTVATLAREALSRIEGGEHFDLILCDLMMPELSGMDVYEHLARNHPEVADRIVFMTGGAFSVQAQAFLATRPEHLRKPFTTTQVHGLIERRLSAG